MIHKRPHDEEFQEVSCKHPRHWENSNHFQQVTSGVVPYDSHKSNFFSGTDEDSFSKHYENQPDDSSCFPQFLWVNNNIMEADADLDMALNLSLFPEYFSPGPEVRAVVHSDEVCSSLLDYSPEKAVPIGLEYQADVPEWRPQDLRSAVVVNTSDYPVVPAESSDLCLMGTCLIPMPGVESPTSISSVGWGNRTGCKCLDQGSVQCVKLHIEEAREKLRKNLGLQIFEHLGFCDMGEDVAKRWTPEEEQRFHEVLLANPMSLGGNFWDHLLAVFPSRTKKDIVSYYFNVYVLRKRADQNRFDPVDVDSDDDEWQRPDDVTAIEDDKSVVESPPDQDVSADGKDSQVEDFNESTGDEGEMDSCKYIVGRTCRVTTDEDDGGDIDDIFGPIESFIGFYGDGSDFKGLDKIQRTDADDYDNQDDSCTSFEYQRENGDSGSPSETGSDDN